MLSQSEIKYNRLMEKAEELFVQLGYKAVSMDEIAEAAGISKMTIYKHFSSKEELFIGIIMSIMDRSIDILDKEIKRIPTALGKIEYLMKYNIEMSKDYSLAFYKDVMAIQHIRERVMEKKKELTQRVFEAIIKEGMEKGEIRKVNTSFVAGMLIALVEGFGNNYLQEINSQEEIDEIIEDFYDFIKYGLLGKKG